MIDSKPKNVIIFFKNFLLFFLLLVFLPGCASVPIEKSSYIKNLYRRVPYVIDGNYRILNFFYATSRETESSKDSSLLFGNKLAENLTYGELNVKIDPSIKIGTMLPATFKKERLIGLEKVDTFVENDFIAKLKERVDNSPHHSLLIAVFGYKDNFEFTAIKTAYTMYLLDVNTPVLLFDWPGDQSVTISGYVKSQKLATLSGSYFGDLLTKVIREVKPKNLWIEASSLGCQVVCDGFEKIYQHGDLSDPDEEISHVVLAAPDVSQDEFDLKFKQELSALSKKLTAYVSSDDEALLMSGLINREKKLGRQRIKEPAQLEEANKLLYLKSLDPDKISLIDVTPINNASFRHGYYLESPEFFDDFYLRIFDKDPNVNRRLYLLKTKDNVDYWVLCGIR